MDVSGASQWSRFHNADDERERCPRCNVQVKIEDGGWHQWATAQAVRLVEEIASGASCGCEHGYSNYAATTT